MPAKSTSAGQRMPTRVVPFTARVGERREPAVVRADLFAGVAAALMVEAVSIAKTMAARTRPG